MKQSNAHTGATTEAAVNDDEVSLPTIGGRECVPVRLLPILTRWNPLSPDKLAELLGFGEKAGGRQWPISAHAFGVDGRPVRVPRRAWADIAASLDELSNELTKKGSASPEWEERSLGLLPAGVFLWRDELEAQYARTYGGRKFLRSRPNAHPISDEDEAAQLEALLGADGETALERMLRRAEANMIEAEGDGTLDFRWVPMTKAQRDVVFEGFVPFASIDAAAASSPAPVPEASKSRHILSARIKEAMGRCRDPFDVGAVWAELCAMADRPNPPAPIVGFTSDGKVQYRKSNSAEGFGEFSRKLLGKYLKQLQG